MEIKANLNYLRIAPRKVRLVTNFIKGMEIKEAENRLKFTSKRVSRPLLKLLNSAVSNASNNFKLEKDVLYIKKIIVNEGTPFKRWFPVSRGRAFPILKRTSNINLVLDIKEGITAAKKVKTEPSKAETEEIKKESTPTKTKPIKFNAPKEISKGSKIRGLTKKIFRRKSF